MPVALGVHDHQGGMFPLIVAAGLFHDPGRKFTGISHHDNREMAKASLYALNGVSLRPPLAVGTLSSITQGREPSVSPNKSIFPLPVSAWRALSGV